MEKILADLKAVDFKAIFEALLAKIVAFVTELFNKEVPEFGADAE